MSSRKQRQLLQLSVATLFLFQFLFIFSPTTASNFLSSIRLESEPTIRVQYDIKITSVDGRLLSTPILFSDQWQSLDIQEYGQTQLLIDNLGRALNKNDIEKADSTKEIR